MNARINACCEALSTLSAEGRAELIRQLRANAEAAKKTRALYGYFPDDGPIRRSLYLRHMEFFAAGGEHEPKSLPACGEDCDGSAHRERLMLAANRVGKTESVGAYEVALHATGRYPKWWPGRVFGGPVDIWAAGKNNETTRDVVQKKLFGMPTARGRAKSLDGTGLVPAEDIGTMTWKRGVQNLADTVRVKHLSGGWSTIGLKSYEQGRGSFEGVEKDIIWFDEEPPGDCYTEALVRTMTTQGHVLLTFTPLEGMSEVVLMFLPGGSLPVRDQTKAAAVLEAIGYPAARNDP
jgi:phage terminase large subunit-like protein